MSQLFASYFRIRQPEPPEGRSAFPLSTAGNQAITFVTGDEVFSFSSLNLQPHPSGILSAWIDASKLTVGKNLYINTGLQTFTVAGGDAGGYVIITAQMPLAITVTADAGTAGAVGLILYNYNVFNTGTTVTALASSGTPGGTPGGASGGTSGGTSGYTGSGSSKPSGGLPTL